MAAVLGDKPLRFIRPRLGGAASVPERRPGGRRHSQLQGPFIRSRNLAAGLARARWGRHGSVRIV